MIALQLSTIALMMPTRRYLRSSRIVSIVVRMHKSRDRPRPRQRLLARVRPDRVRYASGAPAYTITKGLPFHQLQHVIPCQPRQQNNQSHSHCSHFTDLFGLLTSAPLQPSASGPTKYSQVPSSSTSAISRTFSVRFLPFLNSICTRGRKQQSK